MTDNVNHPAHYAPRFGSKSIECIDITRHMSFLLGNAFKYVWRAGYKGDRDKAIEDLKKAKFYMEDCFNNHAETVNGISQQLFKMLQKEGSDRFAALSCIVNGDCVSAISLVDHMIGALEKGEEIW